jgi:hypothetical protein
MRIDRKDAKALRKKICQEFKIQKKAHSNSFSPWCIFLPLRLGVFAVQSLLCYLIHMNHENLTQAIDNLSSRMIAIRDSL